MDHDILAWTMTSLQGPVPATSCDWSPPAYGGMFDFRRNLFVARGGTRWHGGTVHCDAV